MATMRSYLQFLPLLAGLTAAGPSVASLGSSYSSGYGLNDSYGKILSDLLAENAPQSATYDNFAVAGSNVTAIATSQAAGLGGKQYDAVVITAGGNDLNYVACLSNPGFSYCGNTIDRSTYIDRFSGALDAIVQNLGNPTEVPIYVVTYAQAIGSNTRCSADQEDCPLTSAQVNTIQAIYENVIDWTIDAVDVWKGTANNQRYITKLIPMRQYSADRHDVGSCEPWINGAISQVAEGNGADWHPTKAGNFFMAEAVYNDLNGLEPPPY